MYKVRDNLLKFSRPNLGSNWLVSALAQETDFSLNGYSDKFHGHNFSGIQSVRYTKAPTILFSDTIRPSFKIYNRSKIQWLR